MKKLVNSIWNWSCCFMKQVCRCIIEYFWLELSVACIGLLIWGVYCCRTTGSWDIKNFLPLFAVIIGGVITVKINEAKYFSDALSAYASKDMLRAIRKISHLQKVWMRNSKNKGNPVASNLFVPPTFVPRECETNQMPQVNISIYRDTANKILRLPWTEEEDEARRLIKHYFLNPLELHRDGKIGNDKFSIICKKCSAALLFSMIEIMENILNEHYDDTKFKELMAGKILFNEEREPKFEDYELYFWDVATRQYCCK